MTDFRTLDARLEINAKTRATDQKARQMRKQFSASQINQRQRMHNGLRTKHK